VRFGTGRPAARAFSTRKDGAGAAEADAGGPGPANERLRERVSIAATLDRTTERAFGQALDRSLSAALPALGAVFGIGVLLFSAWDYWLDPGLAATTLSLRLVLVCVGACAYFRWDERIPVGWRCALVYLTHTGAMIGSSALLPNGLVLAMPAITGAMFPLALVEPRLHRLAALVLPPALLFLLLGAGTLAPAVFASCALVYAAVLLLVAAVAFFQGRLLREAFLAEQALAWSAHHDSLSGVLARGYLLELAEHDLALARRYGRPLAVAMLDIDHFKRVNDTWGHGVGDLLLCAVSRACSAQLRASDYFGRVGGEEFACVMPETGETEALACAERMRRAVADIRLATPQAMVRCTISIGVAALDPAHVDLRALLAAADGALYRAKMHGRDRVELAVAPWPA
jgi:diguanylate cyclase (GGDEF)-like protein